MFQLYFIFWINFFIYLYKFSGNPETIRQNQLILKYFILFTKPKRPQIQH